MDTSLRPLVLFTLLLVLKGSLPVLSQATDADSCSNYTRNMVREPGRCAWFGACMDNDAGTGKLNCYDNNEARNVSDLGDDFGKLLKATCPDYYKSGKVCCNYDMLDALSTQIKYPKQLFSRCPACLKNFIQHFCFTTCDPNQSMYFEPTSCRAVPNSDDVAVFNVSIYLTLKYAEDMYASCSNVQYPQASNRVVDIMCGGTDTCNSTLWLGYLGKPEENNNSPFPMTYIIGAKSVPKGIQPKQNKFEPCNTTTDGLRCSCADCDAPDLCPDPPTPPKHHFPQKTVFYSILGTGFCLTLVVFIATLVIGVYLVSRVHGGAGSRTSSGVTSPSGKGYGTLEDDSPTSSVGSINAEDMPSPESILKKPTSANGSDSGLLGLAGRACLPFQTAGAIFENLIKTVFYRWGCFVAQFWPLVIGVGTALVLFVLGLTVVLHFTSVLPFAITTDPVKLWSAPDSRARQEKDYFDKNFNPFFRTEMLIFTSKEPIYTTFTPSGLYAAGNWTFGPVLRQEVLLEVFNIQNHLMNMVAHGTLDNGTDVNVTLKDICYKPLAPDNNECTIMSVLNYFQNNLTRLMHVDRFFFNNLYHIHYCTRDPTSPEESVYFKDMPIPCLGAFGGPVDPNIILGGFNKQKNNASNYQNATALIVSFTVNNHVDDEDNQYAKIWEKAFLNYVQATQNLTNYTNYTYNTERSIEDELTRESKTDVITILLSYLLMFAYITLFLGHIRKPLTLLVDMKISLGFVGVLLVLFAVVFSICFLNLARVTVTLIIIEVVPFLVLAVGVDNLFILVHSYERQLNKYADVRGGDVRNVPVKELIGRTVAEVAPSLLLTSISETVAFMLGAISSMPAVRTFSLYAGIAVFFNFLLQISVFLAALSLDARRQLANRFDLLYCVNLKGSFDPRKGLEIMHTIMQNFAKFILYPLVRPFVLLFFGITTTLSLAFMFRLDIGLDQTLALPKDSYVNAYFKDLYAYLHTGSPVYFVIKEGFNYSDPGFQRMFCSGAGCDKHSIGTEIFAYSRNSELTGIAEPAMLWLDTYFEWIAPHSECCGKTAGDDFCLYPKNTSNSTCMPCVEKLNETTNWPYPDDFIKYLPWFLKDNPGKRCPSGGHAAFAGGVKLYENKSVETSYIMTLHAIMNTSSSFINGLEWARKLGDNMTERIGVEVFPYSVFYVYYEQYLTTVHDMGLNIGVSIGAVFIVTFLLMGLNLWAALIVMLIVVMIIIHMLGCMALTGINANAVSLVNLVMTVGISVEFCSHIVRWYCSCAKSTRKERAKSALANMGASVVSGITLTKLIGVFVLFFAKSQIFEVYYFRMYMFMLLWGALHGLLFLPVLLSYIGPPYVPIEVTPPYEEIGPPKSVPPSNVNNKGGNRGGKGSIPSHIPPASPAHPNLTGTGTDAVQYPSLPNVGTYEPPALPPAEGHQYSAGPSQRYAEPTYPNQHLYQQQGVISPEITERSRLLHS